ncbi:3-keto-steroid reductase-like [Elysia marginata]|uniref:3-keto-steroid reductase-like n=1 Tax=Elysia marginata TaxID=1093978 RepID=A0AAV4GWZ5_9GAST|nr:3-keto-steroid reductase-like [Elysia marginata]
MTKNNLGERVAVITGGNSGIGFTLAQRLVQTYPNIRLCLACRNQDRASMAAKSLKQLSSSAEIQIVILDTSCMKSVYSAALEIKNRYTHIDLLYLNAGMMVVTGVDWNYVITSFFSSRVFHMLTTGEGALKHRDWETSDGLQAVFQTNLFGHYVLIKELEPVLGSSSNGFSSSQIIWTSSSAAQDYQFSDDDIQHKNGKNPYSSSKYATDIVSVGLNSRMNKQMRLFVPSLTTSTLNGSEALFWLSNQDPRTLDSQTKYRSLVNVFGKAYVSNEKMKIDPDYAENLLVQLDKLQADL